MMKTYGLSQLPVLDEGKSVGSIREGRLMAKLLDNRELMQSPVSEVMDRASRSSTKTSASRPRSSI